MCQKGPPRARSWSNLCVPGIILDVILVILALRAPIWTPSGPKVPKMSDFDTLWDETPLWHTAPDPDYPDYPPDQVSESAARTLPSTRAGGQADVSSN